MSTATSHKALADLMRDYYEEETRLNVALALKTHEMCTRKEQAQDRDQSLGHYPLHQAAQDVSRLQERLQKLRLATHQVLIASAEAARTAGKKNLPSIITYYIKEIDLIVWEAENDVADLGTPVVTNAVSPTDPAKEVSNDAVPLNGTPPAVVHRRAPPEVLQLILADDPRNHGWRRWYYTISEMAWPVLCGSLATISCYSRSPSSCGRCATSLRISSVHVHTLITTFTTV